MTDIIVFIAISCDIKLYQFCEGKKTEQVQIVPSFDSIFDSKLQPLNFYKVEFIYTSSAGKTPRKITQNTLIFWLFTRIRIIQVCEVLLVLWVLSETGAMNLQKWELFLALIRLTR